MSVQLQLSPHVIKRQMKRFLDDEDTPRRKRPCISLAASDEPAVVWASPGFKRALSCEDFPTTPSKRIRSGATAFTPLNNGASAHHASTFPATETSPSTVSTETQPSYDPSQMQIVCYVPPQPLDIQPAPIINESEPEEEVESNMYRSARQLLLNSSFTECRVFPGAQISTLPRQEFTPTPLPPCTGNELVLYVPPPSFDDIAETNSRIQTFARQPDNSHDQEENDMLVD